MPRYDLTPLAEGDLKGIRDWYRRTRGSTVARQVLRDIRETLRFLAQNPHVGHPREDLAPPDTHFWPHHTRFLIIFLPETSPLSILRIWDTSRGDPPLQDHPAGQRRSLRSHRGLGCPAAPAAAPAGAVPAS